MQRLVSRLRKTVLPRRGLMTEKEYLSACNSQLDSLQERLEDIEDKHDIEVKYVEGVLTVDCLNGKVFIINRQLPNRQIWYSSPLSGPCRFNWHQQQWLNLQGGQLQAIFMSELDKCL